MHIVEKEPFDPKKHPSIAQADQSIRAFGIEFQSRYGVLSELRALINAVETWMPRGLFWHIGTICFDSKGGSVLVSLKERDGDLTDLARQIANVLKRHLGDRCTSVFVEDHREQVIADGRGA
ncbi:hypothetical protein [Sphingomonas daechungensis]|uniref:hypothetical protein n=1 Tax=Sphingomonas daechungensis TaxID=1176646 RepID=UPI003782F90B